MEEKTFHINIYSCENCHLTNIIKQIEPQLSRYTFSYYDINEPPPPQKVIGSLIIIEETSAPNIYNLYKNIISTYKHKPGVIIASETPNYTNAVKWMKLGAKNYIDSTKNYKKEEIDKILYDSLNFNKQNLFEENMESNPFNYPEIKITKNNDWSKLENDKYYEMSVLMLNIILDKEKINNFSKNALDSILKKIENLITQIVIKMGGKKFFWNYNNGAFLFNFGDRINCSCLTAIAIFNKLIIYTIESLSLQHLFNIKITLHDGKILYSKEHSNFITSDAINSVVHLQNYNKEINSMDITENIYNFLNPRIKRLFSQDSSFEGRGIFTYYCNYFHN